MKMTHKREITSISDIKTLVDEFYGKVREDELLGPIFNAVIQDNWPTHLEKMYRFWQTILLHEHSYKGSPFLHHAPLPIYQEHFDRWLKLFYETLDTYFVGEAAEVAKRQSQIIAITFLSKLDSIRGYNN